MVGRHRLGHEGLLRRKYWQQYWQLTRDTQRDALAVLVKAIAGLDTSLYWGEGKTSASDGQRYSLQRKVLQKTYSPRFSDFALVVADNYAPLCSTPIECTDRDAASVLDGLLYNESDLELEEHYTDTHGYTDINFAAFAMLDRRFSLRIRGIKKQRFYRADTRDYGVLGSLVGRADRKIGHARDRRPVGSPRAFLRLACVRTHHRLGRAAAARRIQCDDRFYRANRDLGRT